MRSVYSEGLDLKLSREIGGLSQHILAVLQAVWPAPELNQVPLSLCPLHRVLQTISSHYPFLFIFYFAKTPSLETSTLLLDYNEMLNRCSANAALAGFCQHPIQIDCL